MRRQASKELAQLRGQIRRSQANLDALQALVSVLAEELKPLPERQAADASGDLETDLGKPSFVLSARTHRRHKDFREPIRDLDHKLVGRQFASERGVQIPALLGSWHHPDDVDWASLPERFVLKSNRGGGGINVFPLVRDGDGFIDRLTNRLTTGEEVAGSLRSRHRETTRYYAEEFLIARDGKPGAPPPDIKVYCFYGHAVYLEVRTGSTRGRQSGGPRVRTFLADGTELVNVRATTKAGRSLPPPSDFAELTKAADTVSAGIRRPVQRLDFYETDHGIVFGEVTPNSGRVPALAHEWDQRLGEAYEDAYARLLTDVVAEGALSLDYGTGTASPVSSTSSSTVETLPKDDSSASQDTAPPMGVTERLVNKALDSLPPARVNEFDYDTKGYRKKGLDAEMLGRAAAERGLHVVRVGKALQLIQSKDQTLGFFQNMCWTLSSLDRSVTHVKLLTKRVLTQHGLPVADGDLVSTVDDAVRTFRRIGRPVVVKPLSGSRGKGATVDVRTEEQLRTAVGTAGQGDRGILVEEFVPSIDLRVFVVAGQAVAATLRVPAQVTGDGQSTIDQLIQQKNAVKARHPYYGSCLIQLNAEDRQRLADRGFHMDTVPAAGQRVILHYRVNFVGNGGDAIDITNQLHPGIAELAERAAACFPSTHHAGIDILVQRLDQSPDEQKIVICEVNCNNDVPMHEFPHIGDPVPTCGMEIDGYFFSGKDQRPQVPDLQVRSRLVDDAKPESRRGRWPFKTTDTLLPDADWMVSQLDERVPTTDRTDAGSPRDLDQHHLGAALAQRGWDNVRYDGRLIFATHSGKEIIVERSCGQFFARMLCGAGRRSMLEALLATTTVPYCRRATFTRDDLKAANKLVKAHSGPWILRGASSTHRAIRTGIRSVSDLAEAWSDISTRAAKLVLEQAPENEMWRFLLVGGEIVGAVAVTDIGDETHTIGYRGAVDRAIVNHLATVLPLLGNPQLAAVTFARRGNGNKVHWALVDVDVDPVLADYAQPEVGEQFDVYKHVAKLLVAGPRHELDPTG